MAEQKNLCALIPIDQHDRVSRAKNQAGLPDVVVDDTTGLQVGIDHHAPVKLFPVIVDRYALFLVVD